MCTSMGMLVSWLSQKLGKMEMCMSMNCWDDFGTPIPLDRNSSATGKSHGGGVCLYVNKNWCNIVTVRDTLCMPDIELPTVSLRPFYSPSEFPQLFFTVVYSHPPSEFPQLFFTVVYSHLANSPSCSSRWCTVNHLANSASCSSQRCTVNHLANSPSCSSQRCTVTHLANSPSCSSQWCTVTHLRLYSHKTFTDWTRYLQMLPSSYSVILISSRWAKLLRTVTTT